VEIMSDVRRSFVLALMTGLALSGCTKKEEPTGQPLITAPPVSTPVPAAPASPSSPPALSSEAFGFDVNRVPVVNPQLGKFPYVGLIEGYQPTTRKPNQSTEVAFDRYEFFDGATIIPVEGRLTTIEARGQGASAFEVFKTYESLISGLGGVKVYAGDLRPIWKRELKFADKRHRHAFREDQVGVYLLRTPEAEIWVEAYFSTGVRDKENYFLTVVEKKALEARARLLPAEEMKKELDAKGHVALYINFDFDKADIKPESQRIVDEIVKLLSNTPTLNLTIEGHTDNVGAPDYNKRLSDARARSVVASLTARGVSARRLTAVGYGQDKPIADNGTDAGRAVNRRVELVKV
jgi:OOP family OmpA-OmpF porin